MVVTTLAMIAVIAVLALIVLIRFLKTPATGLARVFSVVGMILIPGAWLLGMLAYADSEMHKTSFCISCHKEMGAYGRSLQNDEDGALSAVHYLNNRVDQDRACYECHTEPGLRGYADAKLRGLHDVRVHYFGRAPEKLELVAPFNNAVCLKCHGKAKSFLEGAGHQYPDTLIAELKAGEVLCLDCHEPGHSLEAQ
jgi:nitrate/TMAO reductase-like tetraheme cytochrome c subunit